MELARVSALGVVLALAVAAPASAQSVLVFDENSTHGRARDACMRLGFTCTRAFAADLETQIRMGTWDLVVIDLPSTEPAGMWQDAIADHIAAGGRAIHTQWNTGSLAGLGAAYEATIGSGHDGIPFHRWSASPLFTSPQTVPDSFTVITDTWGTNGFYLTPTGTAYAAAGFTMSPTPGQAAIVVGNGERTIMNGFLFDDFTGDVDTDGIPDITELIMNEIAFLLGAGSPTAPCMGLMEGASCTTMSGAMGTCRMGGCCTGCWNGTRCQVGTVATACGRAGAMCASCADSMACTSDVCTAGVCSNPPAPMGTPCDDGMFCTMTDRCNASATCVGSGARCDDAEECTTDSCDEAMDRCTNAGRPDLTACTSTGRAGLCRAGRCCPGCWTGTTCAAGTAAATCGVGGAMCASCVDPDSCTTDTCTAGVCSNPRAPTGTPCDDGMFCTPTDTCNAAGACIGGGVRCNDGASCTTDTCDESADVCMYVPAEGCTIGGVCVGDGTVNAAYPCLVCDRARNPSDWSMRAAGTPCSMPRCAMGRLTPASVCTDTGVCSASLSERCPTGACADAMSCEPSCVESGCPAGEWCNPMGACAPQLADGATCIADEACTSGECTDGVCCESACDGTCERCDVLGLRGTCSPATAGTDPDMECPLACDGARACMGDTDAGMVATDGGPAVDAGPAPGDSGPIATIDAGGGRPRTSGGCGCRAGGTSSPWIALGLAMMAVAVLRRRG